MNIETLSLTCDEDNIGSIKIIEKNGGEFIDKVFNGEAQVYL